MVAACLILPGHPVDYSLRAMKSEAWEVRVQAVIVKPLAGLVVRCIFSENPV